ncbi:Crp/Fnr family transcriptional regulator [Oscillatoriales cyanobacterium LEGE 11467]|uniref:Crp/Fnr family transcriptional regulator n=1 Tax=Zarconia navalis LEGE 11467 TaxID=1828826 RepID=A0A928VZH7_9CYAN|nr:Crp/Fnr family transcriptional regulator [Zarconia navalis]MBE9042123.1 Crp/Fnr family transcriptional regulator [Zarconia navalis LEGE 11467]
MSIKSSGPINQILAALPHSEYQRLIPHLEEIPLTVGNVLYEPSQPILEVYFPNLAMVSLVSILSGNLTTGIGLVGCEGMVGMPVFLGNDRTTTQAIVQISGSAMKLSANVLANEFNRAKHLQKLLLLYTQIQLGQISQISACKSHHTIEQQLACWLLLIRDCIQQDILPLTQKSISTMLAVRRASITEAAILLQNAGIIHYRRGQIVILNRSELESKSCECYGLIQKEFARLLGTRQ